jgi:hypothetical protein
MLDLAPGFENRNYCLRRSADLRTVFKSLRALFPLLVIALSLSFYLWAGAQNIYIGYQLQQLRLQEKDLLNIRQQLIIEEQILKDPGTLNALVHRDPGMILLQPDQIIPASYEPGNTGAPRMLSSNLGYPEKPALNSALN